MFFNLKSNKIIFMSRKFEEFYTLSLEELKYEQAYSRKDMSLPELPGQLGRKVMAELKVTLPSKYYLEEPGVPVKVLKHPCFMPEYLHSHEFVEMVYVLRGKDVSQSVEGEKLVMKEGDLLILNPGFYHKIGVFDRAAVVLDLLIDNAAFLRSCNDLSLSSYMDMKFLYASDFECLLPRYLIRMFDEQENPDSCSLKMEELLLEELLITISRSASVIRMQKRDGEESKAYRLLEHISRNYKKADLAALADHFGFTEQYASRLIKQKLGENYSDIVRKFRMEEAAKLLLQGKKSCKEIAFDVGYFSQEHFTRTFHSYFHVSPGEYKKAVQSI